VATKKNESGPKEAPARKTAAKKTATRTIGTKAAGAQAKKKVAKKAPAAARASVRPARKHKPVEVSQAPTRPDPPSRRIALAIADAALEKKAVNVQIIDVYGKVDYADYLVVMSGRSDRQVAALARGIAEGVQQTTGERCAGIEGLPEGAWVLMDFGDVVVHIFHDDVRGYYDLESLWIDARRVPVPGADAGPTVP
jgi:ribosome-associated protein